MLAIEDLWVGIDGKEVLKDINPAIPQGETYIIFGKNGSGQFTLLTASGDFPDIRLSRDVSPSLCQNIPQVFSTPGNQGGHGEGRDLFLKPAQIPENPHYTRLQFPLGEALGHQTCWQLRQKTVTPPQ